MRGGRGVFVKNGGLSYLVFLLSGFGLLFGITREGVSAAGRKDPAKAPAAPVAEDPWSRITENRLLLTRQHIRPGEPVTVVFYPAKGGAGGALRAAVYQRREGGLKRLSGAALFELPLDGEGHLVKAAVLSVPSTAPSGELLLRLEADGPAAGEAAVVAELAFVVEDRAFAAEEIPLNQVNTGLRTAPDPQKTAEAERLWAILNSSGDMVYTTGPFAAPIPPDTRRTSFFGDRRVYVYSNGKRDTAIHAGIDYGVPVGTKVYAPAAGRVALAGARIVTGNSVVVDHLPGLYTLYYHLDKIYVSEGAFVEAGALLGESGATGLATGPHLHWEIRVQGENADPDAFCAYPVLDKESVRERLLSGF